MKLGIGLISDQSTMYEKSNRYALTVLKNGEALGQTAGEDGFLANGWTRQDAMMAGTGRKFVHEAVPGMGKQPESEPRMAEIPVRSFAGLTLRIETNAALSVNVLKAGWRIAVARENGRAEIPLVLLNVTAPEKNVFLVELGALDQMLTNAA